MACWARSSMPGGQVGVGGDSVPGASASRAGRSRVAGGAGCEVDGPQAPGDPDSAELQPGGRLPRGRALAAPGLRLALAGGVAVTGPGLGIGTLASVLSEFEI